MTCSAAATEQKTKKRARVIKSRDTIIPLVLNGVQHTRLGGGQAPAAERLAALLASGQQGVVIDSPLGRPAGPVERIEVHEP